MGERCHYVFEQDGREYGLEVSREGEWASNERLDSFYNGKFAYFGNQLRIDEAGFYDKHSFFSWLKCHEDYVVAAVKYEDYNGTFEFCGEVDEEDSEGYELFIYATDEDPYYQGYAIELENLEEAVKLEEIYNQGMSICGKVFSIDEGYSFDGLDYLDDWRYEVVLHEEDSCGGFIPDLSKYQWYETDIPIEEASEILWNMGWSGDALRRLN